MSRFCNIWRKEIGFAACQYLAYHHLIFGGQWGSIGIDNITNFSNLYVLLQLLIFLCHLFNFFAVITMINLDIVLDPSSESMLIVKNLDPAKATVEKLAAIFPDADDIVISNHPETSSQGKLKG